MVRSLEDLGVSCIFGYTGAAILPVMDELAKSSIRIVINANEQCSAFSAAGYSRASEQVGVAIVTSGPAITNTLTAVADSYADSIPLVVIAGQVPEHKLGTDSFQHIDVASVFGPTAKKVYSVKSINNLEMVIKDAYFLAKSGKPGPVVIDLPLNLQQKEVTYEGLPLTRFSDVYEQDVHLSDKQCEQFFDLLCQAKHPLLYLGGGLNNQEGSKAIRRFNGLFRIPSVNTLMAKGVVDETGAMHQGMLGMFGTPSANTIIQENDLFLAIGVRWDDRVAEKVGFAIHAKIAFIDIHPEKVQQIRNERRPTFSFIGNAATLLNDLTDWGMKHAITLDIEPWRRYAAQLKLSWPLDYDRQSPSIQMANVLEILNGKLADDAIVTTGVGNHQLFSAQYLQRKKPRTFLTCGAFGTMGSGMPLAVGAVSAMPSSPVIVVDGDGSFRMNMGELFTIGTQHLPIKILLMNNHADGMVYNLEDVSYGRRHSATCRNEDVRFDQIAKLCGFGFSKRVVQTSELESAIDAWLAWDGPAFLEVITDRNEVLYPVVRPGSSYKEMELGPNIKRISQ
ncbi:MAG: acetolactate synthase [Spirochaetae bacterium HGW-Spirochaetae-4]|nr:MAG: acetolactate synthase [Spirochaetae bacterium HGW-Spirochaetae-4]